MVNPVFFCGDSRPQVSQLRQPRLAVRIQPALRQRRQPGHLPPFIYDDHILAFPGKINKPEQLRLRLFDRCCRAVI
jgi:hypothetical protein